MSVLEWKKLNFFRLKPNSDNGKIKNTVKAYVTACASSSLQKIFCDSSGYIHLFYRNWDSLSFRACSSAIKYCCLTNENNLLLTLSYAENVNQALLKLWDLNKTKKRKGSLCIGTAVISARTAASAVNISYKNACCYIAIGFTGGEIGLFRGTISRDFSNGFRYFIICARRITGINFNPNKRQNVEMFISSDSGIFLFNLTENNDIIDAQVTLDNKIESTNCSTLQPIGLEHPYFIVGRDDAIYCYTTEGKGPCYAIEGEKKYVARFANYLAIVIFKKSSLTHLKSKSFLIVIDILHKIIVLNKNMGCLSSLLIEDKKCYVLTDTNDLIALCERDIDHKLELLHQNYLFDISLSILKQEYCENKKLAKVYEIYGDHLFVKGEYSSAIKKYIKTVGYLEPYNVIRKFLGSKLLSYLSEYMEAIIKTDYATNDHKTLLINCKSRLNLPNKLQEVLWEVVLHENSYKDIHCSISETMKYCNNLKKYDETVILSLSQFLKIINNTSEVMKFLNQLHEEQIYSFFKENSQILMHSYAQQITDILKLICNPDFKTWNNISLSRPEIFISLFMDQKLNCIQFLEYVIKFAPNCSKIFYGCLIETYLRTWKLKLPIKQKLREILKLYYGKLDDYHFLIMCKLYSFWEGLIFFFQKNSVHNLNFRHCIQTDNINKIVSCNYISKAELYIQYLNCLNATSDNSIVIVNFILNENSKKKLKSSLQIFQRISKNNRVQVRHVKDFFITEFLKFADDLESNLSIVNNINHNVKQIKDILKSLMKLPIEFRFNVCNICNQHINYPAVIFLCLHIFHKQCLNIYSEDNQNCVFCNEMWKQKNHSNSESNNILNIDNDLFSLIGKFIRNGILHNFIMKKSGLDGRFSKYPFGTYSDPILLSNESIIKSYKNQFNPFDIDDFNNKLDNYDANLNPFED